MSKHGAVPRSRLRAADVLGEAMATILQRPGRAGLTALGTVLGVSAFVAVLGLTSTAGGQISSRFTVLVATEVIVQDTGGAEPSSVDNAFTSDADARVRAIPGVRAAGVMWTAPSVTVTGVLLPGNHGAATQIPVLAASPGLTPALHPTMAEGRVFDEFHDGRAENVAILGAAAARQLGVTTLSMHPAIFIDGIPFTVIGIVDDVRRRTDVLSAVMVPRRTAEALWGPPDNANRATMIVDTQVGAAATVSEQLAVALRPEAPGMFKVIPPPDPRQLRDAVTTDLNVLFLLLAAVSLVIGAVGIANTTLVAVLERVPEIGLRRALGARPRHIAGQFMLEAAAIGAGAGLAGASLGLFVVLGVALAREWTPIVAPWTVFTAPLIGGLVGLAAGVYPAIRAAHIEPVEALRRQ